MNNSVRLRFRLFFFFLLLAFCLPAPAESSPKGLTGAAVQLHFSPDLIRDQKSFFDKIEESLEGIVSKNAVNLVVFPEYTSVFLSLVPYAAEIEATGSVAEAFDRIRQSDARVGDFRDLFVINADRVESSIYKSWGAIARKFDIYIIPGTYFHYDAVRKKLFNRAFVIGPDGKLIYWQDKVFLTEFEIESLSLDPGKLIDANVLKIRDVAVALTICRDTFFEVWEPKFRNADLWIDIKADGIEAVFDDFEGAMHALPGRIMSSGVSHGLIVCLTGDILEHEWRGKSYFFSQKNEELELHEIAGTSTGSDVVLFAVEDY